MNQPNSIEDWLRLSRQHQNAAELICEDKHAAGQSYFHAALAVECALKAYIWHVERFNRWPDRTQRDDLYTHDLRTLMHIAGVKPNNRDPVAPAWTVVLMWKRSQGYDPNPMPRKVARSMVKACFGENGVVTWLRQKLTQSGS